MPLASTSFRVAGGDFRQLVAGFFFRSDGTAGPLLEPSTHLIELVGFRLRLDPGYFAHTRRPLNDPECLAHGAPRPGKSPPAHPRGRSHDTSHRQTRFVKVWTWCKTIYDHGKRQDLTPNLRAWVRWHPRTRCKSCKPVARAGLAPVIPCSSAWEIVLNGTRLVSFWLATGDHPPSGQNLQSTARNARRIPDRPRPGQRCS